MRVRELARGLFPLGAPTLQSQEISCLLPRGCSNRPMWRSGGLQWREMLHDKISKNSAHRPFFLALTRPSAITVSTFESRNFLGFHAQRLTQEQMVSELNKMGVKKLMRGKPPHQFTHHVVLFKRIPRFCFSHVSLTAPPDLPPLNRSRFNVRVGAGPIREERHEKDETHPGADLREATGSGSGIGQGWSRGCECRAGGASSP